MKIICDSRQTGKTTKLIHLSAKNNIPILVKNNRHKEFIEKLAEDLLLHIPEPIIFSTNDTRYYYNKVYIDELNLFFNYDIVGFTITDKRKINLIKNIKKILDKILKI